MAERGRISRSKLQGYVVATLVMSYSDNGKYIPPVPIFRWLIFSSFRLLISTFLTERVYKVEGLGIFFLFLARHKEILLLGSSANDDGGQAWCRCCILCTTSPALTTALGKSTGMPHFLETIDCCKLLSSSPQASSPFSTTRTS